MKRTIIFLSLLLAVVVSASAAGKRTSKYPGYKYSGAEVYKIYNTRGVFSGYYLTVCLYRGVSDRSEVITDYIYGKAPHKGTVLDEKFKEDILGYETAYSNKKTNAIRQEFKKLTSVYDPDEGTYIVASNASGTVALYMIKQHEGAIMAWLKKNGQFYEYWIAD